MDGDSKKKGIATAPASSKREIKTIPKADKRRIAGGRIFPIEAEWLNGSGLATIGFRLCLG
jgi:hypothetical protein